VPGKGLVGQLVVNAPPGVVIKRFTPPAPPGVGALNFTVECSPDIDKTHSGRCCSRGLSSWPSQVSKYARSSGKKPEFLRLPFQFLISRVLWPTLKSPPQGLDWGFGPVRPFGCHEFEKLILGVLFGGSCFSGVHIATHDGEGYCPAGVCHIHFEPAPCRVDTSGAPEWSTPIPVEPGLPRQPRLGLWQWPGRGQPPSHRPEDAI
jgi:hypothetical protein